MVENYKLSPTHYNNYLNILYGEGPRTFFEQNLVRFPQPMSIYNIFGSSIHKTIEFLTVSYKKNNKSLTKKEFIDYFKKDFSRKRISKSDLEKYLKRGEDALKVFYDQKIKDFNQNDKSEVDFSNEGVIIDAAHITGKIDLLKIGNDNFIDVYDFKTGNPIPDKNKSDTDKVKEWNFKNQIIFYKLLIENSKNYKKYQMRKGIFVFVEPDVVSGKEVLFDEVSESPDEFEISPDDLLIRREREAEFMNLLNQLPLPQRSVLLLHFVEDFSLEEVSRITQTQLGTVKSRLHYAKRALRKLLGQHER